jgi:putative phosphotransacetylase
MFGKRNIKIPVEISARHCHLARVDFEVLFGAGRELKMLKQLSQPSEFACEETVTIKFGTKQIEKVRIIGPLRQNSQVEISITDAVGSGVMPPIRLSGDVQGSSSVTLCGPNGCVELKEGLIVARRHIHCSNIEAKKYKLKDGAIASVEILGERSVIFNNIAVRTGEDYITTLHLDTDEGNAAGINKACEGIIL